jgi:hypothetical protein
VPHPNTGTESLSLRRLHATGRSSTFGLGRDWDLLILIGLMLANIRIFNGSSIASFELVELFAWGYCAPVVVGTMLNRRGMFCPLCSRLLVPIYAYVGWLLVAAAAAVVFRHDLDVLQQTKNVVVAVPIVMFVCIRLDNPASFGRIINLYVLYCFAACVVAVVQYKTGGPYFRPPVENNQYKLDYAGELVDNVVLGFSATPNQLALITLPGIVFSMLKLVAEIRSGRIPRLVTVIATLVTGTVFVLAQSRGALIWALAAVVFFIAPTRRSRSFLLKLLVATALIVLIVLRGLSAVASTDTPVTDTVLSRLELWMTAIRALTSDWYVMLLGDGSGYITKWSWQAANWTFPDSHNGWLDQAVFWGVPAVALYVAIWWVFFRIVDDGANDTRLPVTRRFMLDGIRATTFALMGLSFFEPVANAVFPVVQLFIFLAYGAKLSGLPARRRAASGQNLSGRATSAASPPGE